MSAGATEGAPEEGSRHCWRRVSVPRQTGKGSPFQGFQGGVNADHLVPVEVDRGEVCQFQGRVHIYGSGLLCSQPEGVVFCDSRKRF